LAASGAALESQSGICIEAKIESTSLPASESAEKAGAAGLSSAASGACDSEGPSKVNAEAGAGASDSEGTEPSEDSQSGASGN
jgi:hypothetical protein